MAKFLKDLRRISSYRFIASAASRRAMSTTREFKIPVPWGHIAGRESGPEDGRPLLMLHGWLDNCGTFDCIQPHLPPAFRCINVDIPGHGLSSQIPAGMRYQIPDAIFFIRFIRDHFGWDKFSICGHSMGSAMGTMYASLFPEDIRSLIIIDLVKQVTRPTDQHPDISRDAVLGYVKILEKLKGAQPEYTYDELRDRLMKGTGLDDPAHADILLVRGSRRNPDSGLYQYTYDLRQRVRTPLPFSFDKWAAYACRLRCRLLLLLAKEGGAWIGQEEEAAALAVYKKAVPELEVHRVPGGHHVHLTHPENVLSIINRFLVAEVEEQARGENATGSRL